MEPRPKRFRLPRLGSPEERKYKDAARKATTQSESETAFSEYLDGLKNATYGDFSDISPERRIHLLEAFKLQAEFHEQRYQSGNERSKD